MKRPIRRWRLVSLAALLGVGWFGALGLSPWHRQALMDADGSADAAALARIVGVSALLGLTFARFICSARSWRGDAMRALTLPFAGSIFYVSLWILPGLAIWLLEYPSHPTSVRIEILPFYLWALYLTALAFPLVFPYALLCQFLLRSASCGCGPRLQDG